MHRVVLGAPIVLRLRLELPRHGGEGAPRSLRIGFVSGWRRGAVVFVAVVSASVAAVVAVS